VAPGATLSLGDLQRNGMLDVDAVFKLVYNGKGKMYGFGEECAPKGKCTFGPRLSDTELRDVAEYVLDKAEKGW
jgi:cytochrome c6